MGEPRIYKGTFCTGHVPMVGTTSIQFAENSFHEYIEEYKNAHGLKEKSGPGRAKLYDPRAQPPRPSPKELPLAGSKLALLGTGQLPERQARTSSKAIGGWWTDPIFQQGAVLKDAVLKPGEKVRHARSDHAPHRPRQGSVAPRRADPPHRASVTSRPHRPPPRGRRC